MGKLKPKRSIRSNFEKDNVEKFKSTEQNIRLANFELPINKNKEITNVFFN